MVCVDAALYASCSRFPQMVRRNWYRARALTIILFVAITVGLFVSLASVPSPTIAADGIQGSQRVAKAIHRTPQHAARTAPRASYVLALSYMEQLANAISNVLSLKLVTEGDLSATVVLPFVHGSRLFGLPDFVPNEQHSVADRERSPKVFTSIPLSVLTSLTEQRHCSKVAATFGEFLLHSYRDIVLLHPVRRKYFERGESIRSKYFTDLLQPSIRSALDAEPTRVFSCRHTLANFHLKLEEALNRQLSHGEPFKVVEAICFDGDSIEPLPASTLRQMAKRSNASYVWTHWEGSACMGALRRNSSKPHCNPGSGRLLIYPSSPTPGSCLSMQKITHLTPYVEHLAEKYLHSRGLSDTSGLVAVHVRIEKLLPKGAVKCCIQKLVEVIKTINRKRSAGSQSKLLLTTDMGPQGTQSCGRECYRVGTSIHMFMRMQGLHPDFANPADFGGANSSGVAALVDLAALSQGETLVLVGGGQFQNSILHWAMNSNPQKGKYRLKAVHSICSPSTEHLLQSEAAQLQKKGTSVITFTGSECTKTAM